MNALRERREVKRKKEGGVLEEQDVSICCWVVVWYMLIFG